MSFVSSNQAGKAVTWMDLADVGYKKMYFPQNSQWGEKAFFGKDILALVNQRITITGYVIPVDTYGELYFLSARPNSACYFCGQGQKHEVMQLKLKNLPANYKMDEYLTFEGVLKTHTNVTVDLPYSLETAIQVK
jgi:hypothetical protein